MLISTSNALYIVELSVGLGTNLNNNTSRKFENYCYLLNDLKSKYSLAKFVNLAIGFLGISGQSCNLFIEMCTDLSIYTGYTEYLMINSSYVLHILYA